VAVAKPGLESDRTYLGGVGSTLLRPKTEEPEPFVRDAEGKVLQYTHLGPDQTVGLNASSM
jgi:hypothetical protein